MAASTEGTQASSRPMSRVARKLAESSEEIPATAWAVTPGVARRRGGAANEGPAVVTRDEDDAN